MGIMRTRDQLPVASKDAASWWASGLGLSALGGGPLLGLGRVQARRASVPTRISDRAINERRKGDAMKPTEARTATDERRRGVRALLISVVVLAGMLALWWLVATTNREGHHDAQLLPIFTLIPLGIAFWHFAWSWFLGRRRNHPGTADRVEHDRAA